MSTKRKLFTFTLTSLGMLVIIANAQGSFVSAQTSVLPTPTIDRLAKPTLPPEPDMADLGSQDYWLYCSPCHGDKAQGLTEDFRKQYPVEDQYCWDRGCHGEMPYKNGWTIPFYVPALVGPGTLQRFPDGLSLKLYMQLKMPFQTPGNLEDDIYWRLAGFILKQNGYWDGKGELTEATARRIIINPIATMAPTSTPIPYLTTTPALRPTLSPTDHADGAARQMDAGSVRLAAMAIGLIILVGSVVAARFIQKNL